MKEFELYLDRHLHECEVLVYSIPYREGLTTFNRIVLDTCLEDLKAQKFMAVQAGIEMTAKVDRLIKEIMERLCSSAVMDAQVRVRTEKLVNLESSALALDINQPKVLMKKLERAEQAIVIATASVAAAAEKAVKKLFSPVEITAAPMGIRKTALERPKAGMELSGEINRVYLEIKETSKSTIEMPGYVPGLFYTLCESGSAAIRIAARVRGIELMRTTGPIRQGLELGCNIERVYTTVSENASSAVAILAQLRGTIEQFFTPKPSWMGITANVALTPMRYRTLAEVDELGENGTKDIDGLTLFELDYVEI